MSKAITGLTAGKQYDYRIVATNTSSETSKGSNQVFTPGWSLQSTPTIEGEPNESRLESVSCVSSTACMATGFIGTKVNGVINLAEFWNGVEWKKLSAPDPETTKLSGLTGVSCISATDCVATGIYENSAAVRVTLAEAWNGTEWKVMSTPNPEGSKRNYLWRVSCPSATTCIGVGEYTNSASVIVTLAEIWNGTEWKVMSTPNPEGAIGSTLEGVSCSSLTACIAAGYYVRAARGPRQL